ncbi:MAG: hypothetical protein L0Z53_00320 [Acidobacteriales bacterium]|nr:hypothetical protein [Terriglobales bacterium]
MALIGTTGATGVDNLQGVAHVVVHLRNESQALPLLFPGPIACNQQHHEQYPDESAANYIIPDHFMWSYAAGCQ